MKTTVLQFMLGASLTVHNLLFWFTNCDWINSWNVPIGQLVYNDRTVIVIKKVQKATKTWQRSWAGFITSALHYIWLKQTHQQQLRECQEAASYVSKTTTCASQCILCSHCTTTTWNLLLMQPSMDELGYNAASDKICLHLKIEGIGQFWYVKIHAWLRGLGE